MHLVAVMRLSVRAVGEEIQDPVDREAGERE
jgi:hypothetical protein